MKFSILLPTRNRLDLLKLAVASVRGQDYPDWEIVVADNASDADVPGYVQSLGDARIRAWRSPQLLPVTDNWNAALSHASGDYFIMLGDDDALMPGALARLAALVGRWSRPMAVYAQAVQYAYAGVFPGHPDPFLQTGYNEFLEGRAEPFVLSTAAARRMVHAAMAFRISYGFNMQHFAISLDLVARLRTKGAFFQSPYPDYYAANAVLLAAAPLVATPEVLALIGISPKSFGYFYLNDREQDGTAFLQNVADAEIANRVRDRLVPGSNMNDSWLCAMETLARNFPDEVGAAVKDGGYRRLQYYQLIRQRRYGTALRSMRWWELPFYASALLAFAGTRILPGRARAYVGALMTQLLFSAAPRFDPQTRTVPYRNILEAAAGEARQPTPGLPGAQR